MSVITVSQGSIESTIQDHAIVILDFWASWCGPCMRFAPVFEASAEQHPDVVHGKVDTEAERELAAALRIQSIPTLMVFKDQTLVFRQAGALPPAALEELVQNVKGLNMDEVKAQQAQQQG